METGTVLDDRYRLDRRLGHGGMGEVWAGHDRRLERDIAIKIVLARLDASTAMIARLVREARTAASLQHPGITVVHDVSEHDGMPFFVMELLEGTDLAARIRDLHPDGMPAVQVVETAISITAALAYAHSRGVVHRDIKPANIMLLPDGTTKICDFGIARLAEATSLTADGRPMGTPAFMAPEQWRAERAEPRTDLYSLGCTLHTMLAGRPPFIGNAQALMFQHLNKRPPPLDRGDLPPDLRGLIRDLLRKPVEHRPADAATVVRRLQHLLDPEPSEPSAPAPTTTKTVTAPSAPPKAKQIAGPTSSRPVATITPEPPTRRDAVKDIVAVLVGAPVAGAIILLAREEDQPAAKPESPKPSPSPGVIVAGRDLKPLALSPDGKTIAAAWNRELQLWQVLTSRLVSTIATGHTGTINAAAFSSKGNLAATGDQDGSTKLWDLNTGRPAKVLADKDEFIDMVLFSPDGRTLLTRGKRVRTWDIASGTVITTFERNGDGPIYFGPRGDTILSTRSQGNQILVHDPRTGRQIRASEYEPGPLELIIAFSPAAKAFAAWNGADLTLRDLTGKITRTIPTDGLDARVMTFSPDGKILAAADEQVNQIHLIDVISGKVTRTLSGHTSRIFHLLAFTPDGKHLVSGAADGTARLWDVRS